MIRNSKSRRLTLALAGWLTAAAGGCNLPNVGSWKMPTARVPDVSPILHERNDDAVKEFDDRRNAAQFLAAQTSWKQGDHAHCRESLEKILDRDPNHRGALLLSADLALETEHPQEAVDMLRRAAAADPHDAEIIYRLGVTLETCGETAEAVRYLRKAVEADPQNKNYATALSEAEAELNPANQTAAATAEVSDSDVANNTEPQQLEEPADATPTVAAAPDRESDASRDPELAAALADWEADRVVECAQRLAKLLQREPDHIEGNILQAEIDLNGGQTAAALRRMDRLVVRYPRSFQVRQACGLVNESAGNVEKANLFFQEAESLAEAEALVTVAYQEPIAGDADDAGTVDSATSAVAVGPMPVDAEVISLPNVPQLQDLPNEQLPQDAATLLGDGRAELEAGKIPGARRLLRAAIERGKDDPHTAVTASIAALKLEQPELALELAALGVGNFPRSAALHRIRGMAAYRLGQYPEAESSLRQSLNLDNSQALSYFLLGSAQSRLGKTGEAQRNLREAARLDSRYAQRK